MFGKKNTPTLVNSRPIPGKPEFILLAVWLLINGFFLAYRGIYLEGESAKYLDQAHLLLTTGAPESPNYWLYTIQILLVACCLKFHLSLYFVVLIQLLFNGIATAFFYKTLQYIFGDHRTAFIGTLLLLADYFYQEFNTFLYTESLFYSFTLILSCYLIHIQTLTVKKGLTVAGLLVLICITRPTGILFLPPAFLYLFLVFFRKMSAPKKIMLLACITVAFLFLLNLALGSGGELDFMLPFRDERIICGVPTLSGFLPIKTAANGNSLYGLLYYILHNTPQFIKMVGLRTRAFVGLYRDYFSTGHNIYLLVYFNCLHLLALASLGFWVKRDFNILCYLISAFALTWLTVILTCDDWHNRFYLTISPFLIILAMPTVQKLMKKPVNDN
ncbi:MAG TPA: glycosyltransferase family 39 protein [Puia sp.]|jgi:hypothetical protein|nr:glycosyltransferase family 39 protein [Puia sp.]